MFLLYFTCGAAECGLKETAFQFYQRIRGYWGVENRVHYVRDVTQGEDKSRIRTTPLPQVLAIRVADLATPARP